MDLFAPARYPEVRHIEKFESIQHPFTSSFIISESDLFSTDVGII